MGIRDNLITIYNLIAADETILSLLQLTGQSTSVIQTRILKVRQLSVPADKYIRICLHEAQTGDKHGYLNMHVLMIDVLVGLEQQRTTGVAFTIIDRIKEVLDKQLIGTGLHYYQEIPDAPTAFGWYRGTVVFRYNFINKTK